MEPKAKAELLALCSDALRIGGAPIEMRVRRLASALRSSEPQVAAELMPLIAPTRSLRGIATPAPVDSDSRQNLLKRQERISLQMQPVFTPEVSAELGRLVSEQQSAEKLLSAGLTPIHSVLLSGKPGVGKTLTAGWIAQELGLPLLTLDLATVMSSYLGKTGSNVRAALEHAQQISCVLLLDEFDAIAKRRDDDHDVGELKRLVTVLLQAIDEWNPTSILIAATNHGDLLDPAIWRRFDMTVEVGLPGEAERKTLLERLEVPSTTAALVARFAKDATPAELTRAVNTAQKGAVLSNADISESLLHWTKTRHVPSSKEQAAFSRDVVTLRMHSNKYSARDIAAELGTSHTSVLRTIRSYLGEAHARTQPSDRVWRETDLRDPA